MLGGWFVCARMAACVRGVNSRRGHLSAHAEPPSQNSISSRNVRRWALLPSANLLRRRIHVKFTRGWKGLLHAHRCACMCVCVLHAILTGSKTNGTCAHLHPTRKKAVKAPAFELSDSKPVASQDDELCKKIVQDFCARMCPCLCVWAHKSVCYGHRGVFPVREWRGIHHTLPEGLWKRD